ncbi:MAG TPA: Wzt carbohydrate-binding domain-containing protein, partial [Pyrinomonadaceae bacterium]
EGRVDYQDSTEQVIDRYLSELQAVSESTSLRDRRDRQGSGRLKITGFHVLDRLDERQKILRSGGSYKFVIEYEKGEAGPLENVVGSIALTDSRNEIVFLVRSNFTNENLSISSRTGRIECHIEDFNLAIGSYHTILYLSYGESEILDWITNATSLVVGGGDYFGTGHPGLPTHCKVLTRAQWKAL